jgi:hypothetical protein
VRHGQGPARLRPSLRREGPPRRHPPPLNRPFDAMEEHRTGFEHSLRRFLAFAGRSEESYDELLAGPYGEELRGITILSFYDRPALGAAGGGARRARPRRPGTAARARRRRRRPAAAGRSGPDLPVGRAALAAPPARALPRPRRARLHGRPALRRGRVRGRAEPVLAGPAPRRVLRAVHTRRDGAAGAGHRRHARPGHAVRVGQARRARSRQRPAADVPRRRPHGDHAVQPVHRPRRAPVPRRARAAAEGRVVRSGGHGSSSSSSITRSSLAALRMRSA